MDHGVKVVTRVIGVKLVMGVKVILDYTQEKYYFGLHARKILFWTTRIQHLVGVLKLLFQEHPDEHSKSLACCWHTKCDKNRIQTYLSSLMFSKLCIRHTVKYLSNWINILETYLCFVTYNVKLILDTDRHRNEQLCLQRFTVFCLSVR